MPLIIDMQRGFNHMDRDNVKQLTLVALFAALVTVSIYLFRIPSFDGKLYFHLGETMMIAGAFILGKRNGALAAGIGHRCLFAGSRVGALGFGSFGELLCHL